ncbi:MAG TPA: hypothetical protein DCF43_02310, partial [Pseudomonas sp.]|nr:hypothetical protein [Pseudomonas sp.]
KAMHVANLAANQIAENHKVQHHRDRWRQQGLRPNS